MATALIAERSKLEGARAPDRCRMPLILPKTKIREPEISPEALAARAQQGSVEAFERLVETFEGRVFNFLLRRVSAAEADDLAQETFIRAWQRIHQYRPQWRFSTWLFTIASRLASSRSRRIRPERSVAEVRAAGPAMDAGARLSAGEDRARIWVLVDELLTEEQRTAVWLRYVEGMALQDIARVIGKSHVGVRVMLHRARCTLAEGLQSEGFAEEVGVYRPEAARKVGGAA
jgi:RNA polymerase sigma-70 factor, ECF subfamily